MRVVRWSVHPICLMLAMIVFQGLLISHLEAGEGEKESPLLQPKSASMTQTAPATFTTVNATADETTSAESPTVAAVMWTSVPTWMPSTDTSPARLPWSMERATT